MPPRGGDRCKNLLHMACPELIENVLFDRSPSEIKKLWQAFEEVNDAFWGVVRWTWLVEILIDSLKLVLAAEFDKALLSSSSPATDQKSGSTDTVYS